MIAFSYFCRKKTEQMLEWPKIINKTLSVKLSLMVVCEIALLLIVALAVMFYFSRQTLKAEAMRNAEQTLEGTVQHIDNILLSIEQSTGNIYWDVLGHIDDRERLFEYCKVIVESNPYIVGCAIAMKPGFYPDQDTFMAYIHRKGNSLVTDENTELVRATGYGSVPYTEQAWYTEPVSKGRACWTEPLKSDAPEDELVTSFCLPLFDRSWQCVGVVAADLSIALLKKIVLSSKPSENGYSMLLGREGTFIVHPDPDMSMNEAIITLTDYGSDASVMVAGEAMMKGETGYKPFHLYDEDWYVFYKPFERAEIPGRSMEDLGWSVGVIYPEDDIFGGYKTLQYLLLVIAIVGLVLVFVLCTLMAQRQLKPLHLLTESAASIARGNYDEVIPDTRRSDEIGQLQEHFKGMQQALAARMAELQQKTQTLEERNEALRIAYTQMQEADRVKTAFLHNMTNQMTKPAEEIAKNVKELCIHYQELTQQEASREVDAIQQQGQVITDLLNGLIEAAEHVSRKEETHE